MLSDITSGREVFRGRLSEDEHVVWYGQPKPSALLDTNDIFLIPFSLLWGGFALFWEGFVIAALLRGETKSGNGGDLRMFAVFGIVMVLAGLYLMLGRFLAKRWLRRRTHYALTEKRALVLVDFMSGRSLSLHLGEVTAPTKSVRKSGIGTIQLAEKPFWMNQHWNTGLEVPAYVSKRERPPPVFYDIADADRVYDLMNELRRQGRTSKYANR